MLYQPTIFYYPALLVAFVTVAVKVLKQRIQNERQNRFDLKFNYNCVAGVSGVRTRPIGEVVVEVDD